MKIRINGELADVSCATLAELLEQRGQAADQVATAVNREFVPAAERDRHELNEGDSVEVIAPMSGG